MNLKTVKTLAASAVVAASAAGANASTTSGYVQDGLVACWDGYENGGRLKHENAPSAWVDVVGGLEVEIPDWVTVEETAMLSAAGKSKTAPFLTSIPGADEASVITVEQVIQNTGWTFTDEYDNLQNVFSTPRGTIGYRQNNAKGFYYFGPSSTTKRSLQNWVHATALVKDLHTVSGVFGSGKGTDAIYMDAVQDTVNFNANYTDNYATKYSFFGNARAGIRVCSIRVYNRRLTADEIAANRAIDVKRFVEGDVYGEDGVFVRGGPVAYQSSGLPTYGFIEKTVNDPVNLTAPEYAEISATERAYCTGWKLYDRATDELVAESTDETRRVCAFTYKKSVRLVWQWDVRYPVTVSATDGLTVTPTTAWGSVAAPAEFTVAGTDFPLWTGEGLRSERHSQRVSFAPTAAIAAAVTQAVVREPTDVEGLAVAIASSEDGDVVVLPDGTNSFAGVTQDEMTNELAITKAVLVTSRSGDPRDVTIDLAGTGSGFTLNAAGARLKGITFTSSADMTDSGILALPRFVNVIDGTLDGCVFSDIKLGGTANKGCYPVKLARNGVITGCLFTNIVNKAAYANTGGAVTAAAGVISNTQFIACNARFAPVRATGASTLYVEDCLFSGVKSSNSSTTPRCGAIWAEGPGGSTPLAVVRRTVIANNAAYDWGGAAYLKSSNNSTAYMSFSDCVLTNNSSSSCGVLYIGGAASFTCDRCVIADNTGGTYGVVNSVAYYCQTFRNCLIRGNLGKTSGGVTYAANTSQVTFKFENCTVTGNRTTTGGVAAIGLSGCGNTSYPVWVKNCIVWGNTGADVQMAVDASKVSRTCYPEAVEGNENGNFAEDPLLAADCKLQYSSPCLDVAADLSSTAGTKDLVGTERPQAATEKGAIWDMGCYEMPPNTTPLEVVVTLDVTQGASPAAVTATAKTSGTDLTGLVYDWTVTYTTQSGVTVTEYKGRTEPELALTNLAPGSYSFAVKVTNGSGAETPLTTCDDTFAAKPSVCYVSKTGSATWPYDNAAKAARILADAITNAAVRVEIAAGEYDAAEMGTMTDATFGAFLGVIDEPVEVRGAGRGATVIDFGNAGAGFLVKNTGARVDGLTLLNAASTAKAFSGAAFYANAGVVSNVVVNGGAIWGSSVYVGAGAVVADAVITNLTCCSGKTSACPVCLCGGTLEDVLIVGNAGYNYGGISVTKSGVSATAQLRRVRVLNNTATSGTGALECSAAADATDCEFSGNVSTGGNGAVAVINSFDGVLTMRNCRVTGNSIYKCAAALYVAGWSTLNMKNVLVAGNFGRTGTYATADYPTRAIRVEDAGMLELVNCTVTDNTSVSAVNGGISVGSHSKYQKTIENCVFWGNRGIAGTGSSNAVIDASARVPTIGCSCWPEATEEGGCTSGDPKLRIVKRYRYYPSPKGSCYETGDATGWTAADVDLAGKPRLRDGKIDIGCYQAVPLPGLMLMLK